MQQHNILASKSSSTYTSKGHALFAQVFSLVTSQILDYGASHHMTRSQDFVISLSYYSTSQIAIRYFTQLLVLSSGIVSHEGVCLQDVLIVLDISISLLLVYQICHSSIGRIVDFFHIMWLFKTFMILILLWLLGVLIMLLDYTNLMALRFQHVHLSQHMQTQ